MGLRLISGQMESGAWNYKTERLNAEDLERYDKLLKTHWPWSAAHPRPPSPKPGASADGKDDKPVAKGVLGGDDPGKVKKTRPNQPVIDLHKMPYAELFWFRPLNRVTPGGGDNSNAQFALLGLWVARRHDVPSECPILLGYEHFRTSQNADGGWAYSSGPLASSNTMTCAGLMALAMGNGAFPTDKAKGKDSADAAAIKKALHTLSEHIGVPAKEADARPPMQNMYFMWSVERVAVLSDLKTIGGKDWYAWGAQILVANQAGDGHWAGPEYTGGGRSDAVDTCFALLFLKRANLAPDLTRSMRLHMFIRDPGTR
jgi:hypothetical protein